MDLGDLCLGPEVPQVGWLPYKDQGRSRARIPPWGSQALPEPTQRGEYDDSELREKLRKQRYALEIRRLRIARKT